MIRYFSVLYQHSPICQVRQFICCVRVADGENGPAKALDCLRKHRGKVFAEEPKRIARATAKRLCPALFKKQAA